MKVTNLHESTASARQRAPIAHIDYYRYSSGDSFSEHRVTLIPTLQIWKVSPCYNNTYDTVVLASVSGVRTMLAISFSPILSKQLTAAHMHTQIEAVPSTHLLPQRPYCTIHLLATSVHHLAHLHRSQFPLFLKTFSQSAHPKLHSSHFYNNNFYFCSPNVSSRSGILYPLAEGNFIPFRCKENDSGFPFVCRRNTFATLNSTKPQIIPTINIPDSAQAEFMRKNS